MSSQPLIAIRDLHKIYRVGEVDVPALRGVNLEVEEGEFLSVVGPSGSGKSTMFHILGGLMPATSGTVVIRGRNLVAMSEAERTRLRKSEVGFVFQRYNLLPTLTARDNIAIARHIDHKPRALSGGEQQRVAIARAIVNHPSILLADEPTGNLDTKTSANVLKVLKDLNRTFGQTILMITHNPDAAAVADRIVHMLDGRIVA